MMIEIVMIVMMMNKYDDADENFILHHHITFYHHNYHHHHYYHYRYHFCRGLKNLVFPPSDRLRLHEQKSFFHIRFPPSPNPPPPNHHHHHHHHHPLAQRGVDSDGDHVNYTVMATGVEEVMMNGSCSGDRGDGNSGNSHRTAAIAIDLDTVTVVSNFFRSEKYQRNRR
jgi:hypothetical protein